MSKERDPIYSAAVGVGRLLFGFLRIDRQARGTENIPDTGGAVLAITHFGYLDFALVEWVTWLKNRRHVLFLATKRAFDKPAVGFLLRGMTHIEVDMNAGAGAFEKAVAALKQGEILGVFPEGGVSASYTVRELKTGTARMAAEAGVPIIPVAVWGGHRLMTKKAKSRLIEKFGIPVHVSVGTPIVVAAADDPAAVTRSLHSTLQGFVDELQRNYPVDGSGQPWQPAHLGGLAPTPAEAATAEAERQARRATQRD